MEIVNINKKLFDSSIRYLYARKKHLEKWFIIVDVSCFNNFLKGMY